MKLINIEKLTNKKFLNLYELTFQDEQGTFPYYVASRRDKENLVAVSNNFKSDAVTIVPVTKDGQMILISQFRQPLNTFVYELPSGLVEKDEDLITAVSRELLEETGYKVNKVIMKTPASPMSAGMSDELSSVVVVEAEYETEMNLEREEDIRLFKINLKNKEMLRQFLTDESTIISMSCRLILSSYV